jgi:hypothetical protein
MRAPIASALATLVVSALLLASEALAGYRLVQTPGAEILVSNQRVRIGAAGTPVAMVVDVARGRVWLGGQRRYWEGTVADYCSGARAIAARNLEASERRLEESLRTSEGPRRAEISRHLDEVREARRATSGTAAPGDARVVIERPGETAVVAGQRAERVRVLVDGQPQQDLWLSTDAALATELGLARGGSVWAELASCAGGIAAPVAAAPDYRSALSTGWPLRATIYARSGPPMTTEVTSIETRDLPETLFAPPPSASAVSLEALLGR